MQFQNISQVGFQPQLRGERILQLISQLDPDIPVKAQP